MRILAAVLAAVLGVAGASALLGQEAPANLSLQEALDRYVGEANRSRAAAAALVGPAGMEVAAVGHTGRREAPEATSRTYFEVGSVTKVFTGILLAHMVDEGIVSLDTTVGELMPGDRRPVPEVAGATLLELATHTSGLPRMPPGGPMLRRLFLRPSAPYDGSTADEVFDAAAALRSDDLGERGRQAYSNLGFALLGRLLEEAAGRPYERLVDERVLAPLALTDTRFTREVAGSPRLARAHRENLRPTRSWLLDGYNPAGGLASTVEDMARFLRAAMEASEAGADGPLARSMEPALGDNGGGAGMGLGWVLGTLDGEPLIWHNGRTGGYYSFLGFLPESGRGVVLLTNTSHSGDAFAASLLRGEPAPEAAGTAWPWTAFTLFLLVLAPLALHRSRRGALASLEEASPWDRGRIHFLGAGAEAVFLLALAWKLGVWNVMPDWIWWIGAGLTAALAGAALGPVARLPWWPQREGWWTGVSLGWVGLVALLALWAIFRL